MALFKPSDARERARRAQTYYKTADTLLLEHVEAQSRIAVHDIFMSHAFDDRLLILGTVLLIEDMGYKVYLDWRDDPSLNRNSVTVNTANVLRARMKSSKSLFFATTENASSSKWMPWELGFKDGDNTRVAILPFSEVETSDFRGQEYLGIYPYVDTTGTSLWIHRGPSAFVKFEEWVQGKNP